MVLRRSRPPPFFPTKGTGQEQRDHWIVVETMWGQLVETTILPAGADLLRSFLVLLLRYHDQGWLLSDFGAHGAHFYATKDGRKLYIQITSWDPATPKQKMGNLMDGIPKRDY